MPTQPPKIDERGHQEIVAQTQTLAEAFSGWQPPPEGRADAGTAVIGIFGRLTERLIQRLNQVPDKNLVAFLDLIGAQVFPTRPARVPLTFYLAPGSTADALVPARTPVAAPPDEGEEEEVIFETDRDLVVTPAQLTAVWVRQPDADRYGDYTRPARGETGSAFPAFAGERPIEHNLYLARDDFFTLPGLEQVVLTVHSPDAARLAALPITWSYWNGDTWEELSPTLAQPSADRWQVTLAGLPGLASRTINGLGAGWLRARLDAPLPAPKIRQRDLVPTAARSGQRTLDLSAPFDPFGPAESPTPYFYLYLEPLLDVIPDGLWGLGGTGVTLDLALAEPGVASSDLVLAWEYFQGSNRWEELGQSGPGAAAGVGAHSLGDETQALTEAGRVSFQLPTDRPEESLHGLPGRWLRVRIGAGDYTTRPQVASVRVGYQWTLPQVARITTRVTVNRSGLVPELGFAGSLPLDLKKDFYPFGEAPRPNDAFYLASQEVLAKPGATVTAHVTLSDPPPIPPQPSDDLDVAWEVWNGAGWQGLKVSQSRAGVKKLIVSGAVTFTLPSTLGPGTVNGESGYWLRARIVKGGYGTPVTAEWDNAQKKIVTSGGYGPPSLAAFKLDYGYTPRGPLAACQTENDFTFYDCTDEAATPDTTFPPFTPAEETRPALYLGFDRPLSNRPMTLYARVDPPQPGEVAGRSGPNGAGPAHVVWEYAGPGGWQPLGAQDETNALAESGLIRFIAPPDPAARVEFGQRRYWLRARWESGAFPLLPRLRRVLTNTTWASQATTIQNEILGSSTGEPQQIFQTTQSPVLLGQRLQVREPEIPHPAEEAVMVALEGEDAVTTVPDEAGRPEEVWVRWHPVLDFHGSGPRDRHYVFDHLRGEVRFGNGQQGLVPPRGRNNVRLALYRAGGGTRGNLPAETISQLKAALPYVAGATNLEAATGGAAAESLARVKERGPKTLRHRGRAVTAQDFEDLVFEASPDVARVQVITPRFDPIALEWLPTYGLALEGPGEIVVEASWPGEEDQHLAVRINGPGQQTPYAQGAGPSPLQVSYTVTPEQFESGDVWRVTVANLSDAPIRSGTVKIVFPVGSLQLALDAPADYAHDIGDAGRVDLIIVPRSAARQPTPSLALIRRVEDFVLARCAPTVEVWVTEPDWVEVTVTAQVAPVSFQAADAVRAAVVAELERFLHPLAGGWDGRGWPFGRRPHLSDLYTLIESVAGVDYVRALSVFSVPSLAEEDEDDPTITTLPRDRWDRFLIYAGQHQISVVPSLDSPDGV